MGLIREPEGVDFVIEPHTVTEEEHLSMLAFIAACQDRKAEQHVKRMEASETAKFYEGIDADAQYREDFDDDNDEWIPIDEFKESVINTIERTAL